MDQVKEQLAVVMKYGFWISCSLVLILATAFWYMSTSALDQENESQKRKIQGMVSEVDAVESQLPTHPNAISHAKMEELIAVRQQDVLDSWEELYQRQQDLLVWPVEELKEDFVSKFMIGDKPKIPIENYVDHPTPPSEELASTLRTRYARYIENVLPDIAKIGGAEWTATFKAQGMGMGMGGMGGMMQGPSPAMMRGGQAVDITGSKGGPLVKWSDGSQSGLLSDLFPWRSTGSPTTLQISYSQENLWIWRQMMEIIAQVNGAAQQPYQAKIHEIDRLSIGSSVQFEAGTILLPGQTPGLGMGGMGDGMGMDQQMMADMEAAMMGGMGGMGGRRGSKAKAPDPADNRYVDEARKPIEGTTLRKALSSKNPSDVALAVAKRIPVMMSLKMNQRAVPELLAACGSAKLMIQVEQVRVLPNSASSSAGGGMDGMMGGGMGGMMEEPMMGGGMGGMMGGPMGGAPGSQKVEEFPLDMTVEIYGLIYIYNPMNREQLGLDKITEETVSEVVANISGEVTQEDAPADQDVDAEDVDNDVLPNPGADPATDPADATDAAPATDPADAAPAAEPAAAGAPVTQTPIAPGANDVSVSLPPTASAHSPMRTYFNSAIQASSHS